MRRLLVRLQRMKCFETPLVFDGGLGTHLESRGNDISGQLWSAQILRENPAEIQAAHEDFYRAGAQVATTASYQVTFDALGDEAEELLRRSVEVARAAANNARPDGLVAASVGPYGAGPGEGTDYDGAYGLGCEELKHWHQRRIEVLAATDADFLLAETIPNVDEAAALLELLDATGKPYALSVTGVLAADPAKVAQVIEFAKQARNLGALGVNCCDAETAKGVVKRMREGIDLPVLAYPNSGETWDHAARQWRRDEEHSLGLVEAAPQLRALGVTLLGGCCRTTPEQIRLISQQA
ncbi:TPA: homocysteine S-methyltransferase [Corynebacterium striatum]|nr:homocysteine S-methyltransferase [Corynebacterium striatum]NHY38469.1 homocysteine S-methyltransferase [Corynebacterium striatum]HAT1134521.1 homocysteine S-methyltransferase [Corynebacterium striatum]HAT1157245.1 homocysteine S-methyltransferase [Corynebacterium striatum]HAT1160527.1 homocysteine S-methyltransferase [Corynebacterium striatum]